MPRIGPIDMFALIAAICFLLALLGVNAPISLVTLGLFFVAIHLLWPVYPWSGYWGNRPPNG